MEPITPSVVSQSGVEDDGLTHYEQFNKREPCTLSTAPRMWGWSDADRKAVVFRPPCNQWACPACGPVLRAKASIRAYLGAQAILESGSDVFFVTLTSSPKLTADQSWWVLPRAWNKLRTRASRKQSGGLYFMVPEHHKDGRAHAHMVTSWSMAERWWKDNSAESGLGYMADSDVAFSPAGAGWYALKYLLKQLEGRTWKSGARRYNSARAWPALPDYQPAVGWQFERVPKGWSKSMILAYWQNIGFQAVWLERGQGLSDMDRAFAEISLEATKDVH